MLPILTAFFVVAASAHAAPANDDFANAKPLAGPPLSVEFDDNVGAGKQLGEPDHAGNAGGHSVWYSWTPAYDAQVVLSTCTIGGSLDSLLAVYTGSAVNALTPVASNDDGSENAATRPTAKLHFDADAGITYRIAVDGKNGSEGEFELVLRGPPPNDDFANAQAIEPGASIHSGSTFLPPSRPASPTTRATPAGHSVWYSWTPSSSGQVGCLHLHSRRQPRPAARRLHRLRRQRPHAGREQRRQSPEICSAATAE